MTERDSERERERETETETGTGIDRDKDRDRQRDRDREIVAGKECVQEQRVREVPRGKSDFHSWPLIVFSWGGASGHPVHGDCPPPSPAGLTPSFSESHALLCPVLMPTTWTHLVLDGSVPCSCLGST